MKQRVARFIILACAFLLATSGIFAAGTGEGAGKGNVPAALQPYATAKMDWRQFAGQQLNVLSIAHAYMLAIKPYIGEFENLTGMKVNLEISDQVEVRRKATLDLSGGTGNYDIYNIGLSDIPPFGTANWLTDLKPFVDNPKLTDPTWYNFADIGPALVKWNSFNGKLISIPVNGSGPIFWYRKDVLQKFGMQPPKTWDEIATFKQDLQKKLDADSQYKGMSAFLTRAGRGAGQNTWVVIPLIESYGAKIFDDKGMAVFNTPEAVRGAQVYKDVQVGYGNPPGSEAIDFYDGIDLFASGRVASIVEGFDFVVLLDDPTKSQIAGKWGAAGFPLGTEKMRYSSLWTWGLGINQGSKHKDAAWLFVEWASSLPLQMKLGVSGSPSRLSVWNSPSFKNFHEQSWVDVAKWYYANGIVSEPFIPEFREFGESISVAFYNILRGNDIQSELDKGVSAVNDLMAKSRK